MEADYVGRKLFFTLSEWPSDSASSIYIHGWIYNEQSREWRRFLKAGTRHLGKARLVYDPSGGRFPWSGQPTTNCAGPRSCASTCGQSAMMLPILAESARYRWQP